MIPIGVSTRARTIAFLCVTIIMSCSVNLVGAPPVTRGEFGFDSLLVTQRHPINSSHVYTYHQEGLRPGGGLWLADFSGGKPRLRRILDSSEGEILDANLHYDGRTILFSWKRTMEDFFQLYTMDIDGSGLKRITDHPSNNFNACWLPDGGIVFLSDRKPAFAYCWRTTTPILWRCDGDGANQIRLSANYLNDFTPSVLSNGRIVYSRWEYVDRPAIPIQGLWTINPDGTRLEGLFGNRVLSPATFMDAREIPDSNGKILCTLTAHNGPCRGAVGIIDPALGANSQQGIRNLTPEVDIGRVDAGNGNRIRGPYLNPFPLDGKYFLVSKSGSIELRDYAGDTIITLISGTEGMGYYCPQPVRIRKREKLFVSQLDPNSPDASKNQATVMMQDVYQGLGNVVARGSIKKLAVVQEVAKPVGISPELRAFGFQFPVVSCGATYAPKKIWGYATVEPDGSASFKVPARQPIYFLPLDAQGRAVQRMRTFTHLVPGEVQACVGCHADRSAVAPNTGPQAAAMLRPPQELEVPEWGLHGFSYPHIVQPIWDKHCIECHGRGNTAVRPELTADKTDFFNVSYEHLVREGTQSEKWWPGGFGEQFNDNRYTSWIPTYNGQEANILEIAPGRWGAKASLLARIIAEGHPDEEGEKRVNLSDAEKRRVYAWLDLNCPYYGTSDSNHRQLRGCRQQLPANFAEMMNEIGRRRCASCHENAGKDNKWVYTLPGCFYIRLENPELNGFLTSPLARAAGGSEKCGRAVFASTDDPDYRRVVESFAELRKELERHPRLDMMRLEDQKVTSSQSDCIVAPDGKTF